MKGSGKNAFANKKQIIIFVVIGVVFLALMIGGTLFLLNSLTEEDPEAVLAATSSHEASGEGEHASDGSGEHGQAEGNSSGKEHESEKSSASYIILDPAFVVNFHGIDGQHFLQVDVTLMTHDKEAEEGIHLHMPLLRNALVMLFGSQSIESLQTTEGKELLRKQALIDIQTILKKEIGKNGIEEVFFTSMTMQ